MMMSNCSNTRAFGPDMLSNLGPKAMVSYLSGSPFLTSGGFLLGCDQTGNESLVPSDWFVPF